MNINTINAILIIAGFILTFSLRNKMPGNKLIAAFLCVITPALAQMYHKSKYDIVAFIIIGCISLYATGIILLYFETNISLSIFAKVIITIISASLLFARMDTKAIRTEKD